MPGTKSWDQIYVFAPDRRQKNGRNKKKEFTILSHAINGEKSMAVSEFGIIFER